MAAAALVTALIQFAPPTSAADVTLTPQQTYDVSDAQGAYAVVATKFGTADQNLDLAVANFASSNVSILNGDGSGKVTSATNYPAGASASPQALVAADLMGDTNTDLALANHGNGTVVILQGTGDGGFATTAAVFPIAGSPQSLAVADLTADGKLDLVATNSQESGGNVAVLTNNGDGSFATSTLTAGTRPWSVAIGDLDGTDTPAKLDLVVSNFGSNDVTIFTGNGDGTFATATQTLATGTGPISVAIADLDSKGKADIVTANNGSDNLSVFVNGDGGLATTASNMALASGAKPFSVAAADFDKDAKNDLVVSNEGTKDLATLAGVGDGTFGAPVVSPAGRSGADVLPGVLAVADFNSDTTPDVIVPNRNANAVDNIAILGTQSGGTSGVTTTTPASGTTGTGSDSATTTTVAAASGGTSPLAKTGRSIDDYTLTAVVLLAAGAFLVATARRRSG